MHIDKLSSDIQARLGISKAFQGILAISLLSNLFISGAFLVQDHTVRTLLVPPTITKSFWVDGHELGPEYLEQMGLWVVQQYASVTPSSIDFQNSQILKYVHPTVHGNLAIRFKIAAQKIKADSLSKYFFPREVRLSEIGKMVAFVGVQETWIADKKVPDSVAKAYLVAFEYDGSNVTIKELRETNPDAPFDAPNEAYAAVHDAGVQDQMQNIERQSKTQTPQSPALQQSLLPIQQQGSSPLPPQPMPPNQAQSATPPDQVPAQVR
jgi:conjugal transfer pilus assembly protein TraE